MLLLSDLFSTLLVEANLPTADDPAVLAELSAAVNLFAVAAVVMDAELSSAVLDFPSVSTASSAPVSGCRRSAVSAA
jgi:hypothetical protein